MTTKRKPSSAARILAILGSRCGATQRYITDHSSFEGIRYKRVVDALDKLVAKGKVVTHFQGATLYYGLPDTPEPEDKFTAPKVDKTKPTRKNKKSKKRRGEEALIDALNKLRKPTRKKARKIKPTDPQLPPEAFPKTPMKPSRASQVVTLIPVGRHTHATREQWLLAAIDMVRPLFDAQGAGDYPPMRVSCGWPKGGRKAIGQCWPSAKSGDKTIEMFISPELIDGTLVLGTLLHELIHAIDDCENGHKGPFRKLALALGFEGKLTVVTPSPELEDELRLMLGNLGPYPHAKLDPSTVKKQGTRMLKVVCPDKACGYTLRTTKKWIEFGVPTCCCGKLMEAK